MYINPFRNEGGVLPTMCNDGNFFQYYDSNNNFIVLIIDSTPAKTSTEGKNTSYAPGYISSIIERIHFDYLELNRFFLF